MLDPNDPKWKMMIDYSVLDDSTTLKLRIGEEDGNWVGDVHIKNARGEFHHLYYKTTEESLGYLKELLAELPGKKEAILKGLGQLEQELQSAIETLSEEQG